MWRTMRSLFTSRSRCRWRDVPRRRAADTFGPVRFAHSDMSGLSLFEEAQYRGVRAAGDLMRHMGHTHISSLGPAEEGV